MFPSILAAVSEAAYRKLFKIAAVLDRCKKSFLKLAAVSNCCKMSGKKKAFFGTKQQWFNHLKEPSQKEFVAIVLAVGKNRHKTSWQRLPQLPFINRHEFILAAVLTTAEYQKNSYKLAFFCSSENMEMLAIAKGDFCCLGSSVIASTLRKIGEIIC